MQDAEAVAWGSLCVVLALANVRLHAAGFLGIVAVTVLFLVFLPSQQPSCGGAAWGGIGGIGDLSARVERTADGRATTDVADTAIADRAQGAIAAPRATDAPAPPRRTLPPGPPSSESHRRRLLAFAKDHLHQGAARARG